MAELVASRELCRALEERCKGLGEEGEVLKDKLEGLEGKNRELGHCLLTANEKIAIISK